LSRPKALKLHLLSNLLVVAWVFAGCGGGTVTPVPTTSTSNTPTPPSTGTGSTTPVSAANVVVLGAGQTNNGIDIDVVAPAVTPQENAELLGVSDIGAGGTAQGTGAQIHRGDSKKILLFGKGLSGSMTVSINGPNDITISNVRSITSTDNTPGIAFDVVVQSNAALGARSVVLRSTNNDVTTFSGGLEVLP
jgi:hypothetical protein